MTETVLEELQYLHALGATDSVLKDLALDDDHDNFVVCETPFSAMQSIATFSATVPIEFGGNSISLTLHKTLSDNSWWIDEEGSVNNVKQNSVQRFMLDSYKHRYAEWMYIIVSPYPYSEDLSEEMKRQCIANCSLLIKY